MVADEEREEVRAGVDDHPKLLHQGLAVEEVVGGHQVIPGDNQELSGTVWHGSIRMPVSYPPEYYGLK